MTRKRNRHLLRNIAVAVTIIAVVVVGAAAAIYWNGSRQPQVTVGAPLRVGDTFTYKLAGSTVLGSSNETSPAEFNEYNDTDYYQVSVTAIQGTEVTLETTWQFKNGTQLANPQEIDLSTGSVAEVLEFTYLYPANLTVNDNLYPQETSGLIVNSTSTQKFADSVRPTDYWSTSDQFMNVGDTSGGTMRYDFIGVNFDRATGMMVSLTRIQFFTSPEIQLTTTWELTGTNAWTVK